MVRWHHQLNGHEFEQIPRDSVRQRAWRAMGSQIVRHDLATEQHSNLIKMPVTGIQNILLWHKDYLELVGYF